MIYSNRKPPRSSTGKNTWFVPGMLPVRIWPGGPNYQFGSLMLEHQGTNNPDIAPQEPGSGLRSRETRIHYGTCWGSMSTKKGAQNEYPETRKEVGRYFCFDRR